MIIGFTSSFYFWIGVNKFVVSLFCCFVVLLVVLGVGWLFWGLAGCFGGWLVVLGLGAWGFFCF